MLPQARMPWADSSFPCFAFLVSILLKLAVRLPLEPQRHPFKTFPGHPKLFVVHSPLWKAAIRSWSGAQKSICLVCRKRQLSALPLPWTPQVWFSACSKLAFSPFHWSLQLSLSGALFITCRQFFRLPVSEPGTVSREVLCCPAGPSPHPALHHYIITSVISTVLWTCGAALHFGDQ